MTYLGTPPQSGFITTAKQRVTSSTNNYVDLDHSISSIADVIVFVNFVKQDTTNLTLTTSTRITLGATLVSSDIVEIHYLGKAVNTQTPATGTVTSDMLAGSIANSKLATDPLNASNLASGTVPTARLGSGTASSSTFLRGDSTFAEAGGGAWTLLETESTASGSSANFTSMSSTYHTHAFVFETVRTTHDNDVIRLMVINGNGDSEAIYYGYERYYINESGGSGTSTGATYSTNPHNVNLFGSLGSGANEGASGILYFTGTQDANDATMFWGNMIVFEHNNQYGYYKMHGRISNSVLPDIRFYGGNGNFEHGNIRLYGIK